MSRRERELECLRHEIDVLRTARRQDAERFAAMKRLHPGCEKCAALAFDLDLARGTIDAMARELCDAQASRKPKGTSQ